MEDFYEEGFANCADMAAVVQVFSNALGVTKMGIMRIEGNTNEKIKYKSLTLIGGKTGDGTWSYHEVALYDDLVFDACISINGVPTGMTRSDYKTAVDAGGAWKETPKTEVEDLYNTN